MVLYFNHNELNLVFSSTEHDCISLAGKKPVAKGQRLFQPCSSCTRTRMM